MRFGIRNHAALEVAWGRPLVLLVLLVLMVAVLAAILAACSPAPLLTRAPSAAVPTLEPSSPTTSPTSAPRGTLVVMQSRADGGFYTEGAFAYVEVTDGSGRQVARIEEPDYHLAKELARVELPAGSYVVGTYVRPCAAACPALDGPTDGCELSVDVAAAGTVMVRVDRHIGRPCVVSVVET